MNKKRLFAALAALAFLICAWWAWRSREIPTMPAEKQALENVEAASVAVGRAAETVRQGQAIIRKLTSEVKEIEREAIDASVSADLATLADRANARIREWTREHPAGDAVGSPDIGAGAVLAGGDGQD